MFFFLNKGLRNLIRYITAHTYRPFLQNWLLKERIYRYDGLRLRIHPDVFHPGFFFSTRLLLRLVRGLPLHGKTLLELGAGSGLIALHAARSGAIVTASDINYTAVRYLNENACANSIKMRSFHSDLFSNIPATPFDIIVINPPYYFREPVNDREKAWYCGQEGTYFQELFKQIGNYTHEKSVILMILCEGNHVQRIETISLESGFDMQCIRCHSNLIEKNFIYRLFPSNARMRRRYEKNTSIQSQEQ